MTEVSLQRRRTGWDIALGALLVVLGVVILADVVIATVLSVLSVGWLALVAGLSAVGAALFHLGKPGFWSTIISGAVLTVLGLMIIRYPGVAALTLTLVAGSMFLVGGTTRIVVGFGLPGARWMMVIGGAISVGLGLIVLFNIVAASFTLLGVLLGIQVVVDGLMIMLAGRVHLTAHRASQATSRSASPRTSRSAS